MAIRREFIKTKVDQALAERVDPEFWTAVGPVLAAQFKDVCYFIGWKMALATLEDVVKSLPPDAAGDRERLDQAVTGGSDHPDISLDRNPK